MNSILNVIANSILNNTGHMKYLFSLFNGDDNITDWNVHYLNNTMQANCYCILHLFPLFNYLVISLSYKNDELNIK